MLKTIVWFFKSSQQRSLSGVVPPKPECLFICSLQRATDGPLLMIGPPISPIDYSEKPLLYSRELL